MRLNPEKNKGVLSPHAYSYLSDLKISTANPGVPAKLEPADLHRAAHIILMDETEHRPMLRKLFPEWENKVEYWQFEDDYIVPPDQVLPRLKSKVERLVETISVRLASQRTNNR
jgi:protein-tyrosine phosphatase